MPPLRTLQSLVSLHHIEYRLKLLQDHLPEDSDFGGILNEELQKRVIF